MLSLTCPSSSCLSHFATFFLARNFVQAVNILLHLCQTRRRVHARERERRERLWLVKLITTTAQLMSEEYWVLTSCNVRVCYLNHASITTIITTATTTTTISTTTTITTTTTTSSSTTILLVVLLYCYCYYYYYYYCYYFFSKLVLYSTTTLLLLLILTASSTTTSTHVCWSWSVTYNAMKDWNFFKNSIIFTGASSLPHLIRTMSIPEDSKCYTALQRLVRFLIAGKAWVVLSGWRWGSQASSSSVL